MFHPREHGYSCQYTQWCAFFSLPPDEQEFAEDFRQRMIAKAREGHARRRAIEEETVDFDSLLSVVDRVSVPYGRPGDNV